MQRSIMKQNITISLEKDLVRRARMVAAQRATSISRLLGDELARVVDRAEAYERARLAALDDLKHGFPLGGRPATRGELHER
jgi:hypothetical protein